MEPCTFIIIRKLTKVSAVLWNTGEKIGSRVKETKLREFMRRPMKNIKHSGKFTWGELKSDRWI